MPDVQKTVLKIALAADHGGFHLKTRIAEFLTAEGHAVNDLGTHSDDRVDYPDFGYKLGEVIASGAADFGIGVCGSGIGISIALNRNTKIRAALCHDVTSTRLSRQHNDANVLALGERLLGVETALDCVRVFLSTTFEGGRHAGRVEKLGNGCKV